MSKSSKYQAIDNSYRQRQKEVKAESPEQYQRRNFDAADPLIHQNFTMQNIPYHIRQNLAEYAGILQCVWQNQQGKPQTICYGSALAISNRIVLTCGHNVYLPRKGRTCDYAEFILNHKEGKLKNKSKIYRTSKRHFLQMQIPKEQSDFSKETQPEQVALLYMERDMPIRQPLRIGPANINHLKIGDELYLAGYPSQAYYNEVNLEKIIFQRRELVGQILAIKSHILYHNLNTETGHSGSGIFAETKEGEFSVIGIHTHRGRKRNSGLFFNQQTIQRLIDYEIFFSSHHQSYRMNIIFPYGMKEGRIDQLNVSSIQNLVLNSMNDSKKMKIEVNSKERAEQMEAQSETLRRVREKITETYQANIQIVKQVCRDEFGNLLLTFLEQSNKFFSLIKQVSSSVIGQELGKQHSIKKYCMSFNQRISDNISQLLHQLKSEQFAIPNQRFKLIKPHLFESSSYQKTFEIVDLQQERAFSSQETVKYFKDEIISLEHVQIDLPLNRLIPFSILQDYKDSIE